MLVIHKVSLENRHMHVKTWQTEFMGEWKHEIGIFSHRVIVHIVGVITHLSSWPLDQNLFVMPKVTLFVTQSIYTSGLAFKLHG